MPSIRRSASGITSLDTSGFPVTGSVDPNGYVLFLPSGTAQPVLMTLAALAAYLGITISGSVSDDTNFLLLGIH